MKPITYIAVYQYILLQGYKPSASIHGSDILNKMMCIEMAKPYLHYEFRIYVPSVKGFVGSVFLLIRSTYTLVS